MSMIEHALKAALAQALAQAQAAGAMPPFEIPGEIPVERPKQEHMGDLATPICMQLARVAHVAPMKLAQALVAHLPALNFVASAEVAPPGFVNFRLADAWLRQQVESVLAAGEPYGSVELGQGRRVQVEFVSANPTGILHMGSARNAILGDALARVLAAAGYDVQREYFINDAGSRIRLFCATLYARYRQALGVAAEVPADGYHGLDIVEIAAAIVAEHGARFLDLPEEEALAAIGPLGLEKVVASARQDLARLDIRYDCWFSEASLYRNGQYERILEILGQGGHLERHDGALWFKATALGGSKDEVVIRSDGSPGYFASDIAYHYNKFVERGFDTVIDVWGADHQGHVPRMHVMMQALGLDPARLILLLYQLVTLKRGGEVVRLSKRTGDTVTLREVVDEVGADAVRYFLLSRSADSQMEFDLDLAKEQSDANPVYYIQYAHARIASILRLAKDVDWAAGDVALLAHLSELALLRKMVQLPSTVWSAAAQRAPHLLAYYAYELAAAFHAFYRDCRVVSSDPAEQPLTLARLKLVAACKVVLARVLGLMGMTAPEQM